MARTTRVSLTAGFALALAGCGGTPTKEPFPATFSPPVRHFRATALTTNGSTTCFVDADEQVYCWGERARGETGDDADHYRMGSPRLLPHVSHARSYLLGAAAIGDCLEKDDHSILCGEPGHDFAPMPVKDLGKLALTDFGPVGCGVRPAGKVVCWTPPYRVLGERALHPSQAMEIDGPEGVIQLSAGSEETCGVAENGKAWCWRIDHGVPPRVKLLDLPPLAAIGAGRVGIVARVTTDAELQVGEYGAFRCWIAKTGETHCDGGKAPFGTGLEGESEAPDLVQLWVGLTHACGLTASGEAWCWGNNATGQLGQNPAQTKESRKGLKVKSKAPFVELALGNQHTCGLTRAGNVWCWGANGRGEMGWGDTGKDDHRPRLVEGFEEEKK